jgi:ribonuclease HII
MQNYFIVGIDEAGRGPFAGPVAVGICVFLSNKSKTSFRGVKDSKKLTPQKREEWFRKMLVEKRKGTIDFTVSFSSQKMIDKRGLSFAIKRALENNFLKLKLKPKRSRVFLDGGLYAPKQFLMQKTIIKGDEKIPVISLASIAAKVMRDRRMVKYSKKYPKYGFEIHKGYGTRMHIKKIRKYGPSPIHRKSFLKNFDK